MGKLFKLRQITTVLDYQREFQKLSNKVKGLDEKYLISLYLSGLREDIRIGVQKLSPTVLPDVFSLARPQEEEANMRRRMMRSEGTRPSSMAIPIDSKSVAPVIKRLTPARHVTEGRKGYASIVMKGTPPIIDAKLKNFTG